MGTRANCWPPSQPVENSIGLVYDRYSTKSRFHLWKQASEQFSMLGFNSETILTISPFCFISPYSRSFKTFFPTITKPSKTPSAAFSFNNLFLCFFFYPLNKKIFSIFFFFLGGGGGGLLKTPFHVCHHSNNYHNFIIIITNNNI